MVMLLDLSKAYDKINRCRLLKILIGKASTPLEVATVNLLINLYENQKCSFNGN
jgi:hypothetical protein